ncbi:AMP-binding protein [Albimonas sp. CAU 1670]|uniref:AMP-binding protein n=1 Tax=Albimonas sp. CAU 1670 TaxID=3032599 RepID=UPI0023DC039E|nr:AMP-binding protein [Albimonas sp. CAU 1670]MDF2232883.1 AMP-binding protein [Albimonas sp. CAU 1670]
MAAANEPAMRRELHYGNRVVECFADRPSDIHAMLEAAAAARPDAEALVCGELRFTWAQLDEEVRRLAAALHAEGVGPGDRVALLLGNDAPFVVLTYAVARLGAILVPLSLRDQTPGLRHALVQSGAKILICEPEAAEVVPPASACPRWSVASRWARWRGSATTTACWAPTPRPRRPPPRSIPRRWRRSSTPPAPPACRRGRC